MIESAKNKQEVAPEKAKRMLASYHFAGDGIYHPVSVSAADIDEATKLWESVREPIKPQHLDALKNKE